MTTLQALAQNGGMLALLTVVAVGLTILIVMIARRLTGATMPARDTGVSIIEPRDKTDNGNET